MAKLELAMAAAALAAIPAPAAPPAPAVPPAPFVPRASAGDALARQQASLRSSLGLECDRDPGEIVVCGRQGPDPNRLPLPVPPEPGARDPGGPADPSDALALSAEKCTTVGPDPQCGGGLPILPVAIWLVQAAVKAIKEKE